jgi:Tfp pilus assembly protein PilV
MTAGFALVESLVALLLTAIALAALSAGAAGGVRSVRDARERSAAVVLATDRLDALRAGPRDSGSDEVDVAGVSFRRAWQSDGGRGAPVHLAVEVTWAGGHVALESEAFP